MGLRGSFLPDTWTLSECERPLTTLSAQRGPPPSARPLPPRTTWSWGSVPPHGRRGPCPARQELPSARGCLGWTEQVQGPSGKGQWFRVLQVEMRRLLKFRRSRSKPSTSNCERIWGRGSCRCSVLRWGQTAVRASTSPLMVLLKQGSFDAGTHSGTLTAGSFYKPRKDEAKRMKPPRPTGPRTSGPRDCATCYTAGAHSHPGLGSGRLAFRQHVGGLQH